MKLLLSGIFIAVATATAAAPAHNAESVDLIVNGVSEGEPVEIGHILDVQLKKKVDGEIISSSNMLYPMTAQGLAEVAAAAAQEDASAVPKPEVIESAIILEPVALPAPDLPDVQVPDSVVLPQPVLPEVVPEAIVLPEPVTPEIVPEPIVLPAPASPEAIELPAAAVPEVVKPSPEVVESSPVSPEQAQDQEALESSNQQYGVYEYTNGPVSLQINTFPGSSLFTSVQSWVHVVINYIFN